MPNLHSQLNDLANNFAASVLLALRRVPLEDLLGETGRERRSAPRGPQRAPAAARSKGGRLARRSLEDIAKTLASIVSLLKGKKAGLRSEQIRAALKLDKREMPRVLKMGLAKKAIRSKGQKRSTTYFAA
jgi:Fic family protein